ncbi:CRISPR-associated protein Cas4 [Hydrogenimonas cancrithermarum]|uniref:CRISPR-associated exonuclease Cas4 n=1 Tax=Hydrogenimonas cancrithermarum TaxID=2993563 RepID=A0ABN6WXD6_9BACT|nr:CRISPR-associated protein Cas4 [Hydrogenimonas cancrithermarum]BDY12737.1 CRISPR-associated protein Cas4 [Hydrogenimonas cancrithermarum]
MYDPDLITGTTVQYYVTCKREAWLFAHRISADQNDENILMGRALAEIKEEKQLEDFAFSNLKFDKIGKERGHYVVTEYKKSFRNPEGAKMQLLFYMYLLKKNLKLRKIDGKVISGKKVLFVEGNEENMRMMEALLEEMSRFLDEPRPPKPEKIAFCAKCGYRNYCY